MSGRGIFGILVLMLISAGAAAAFAWGRGGISVAEHEAAMAELRQAVSEAEARRDSALVARDSALAEKEKAIAAADSLADVAQLAAGDAATWRQRWRQIRDAATADPQAIRRLFPELVATVDSLELACDNAIQSCQEVVAAKDSVIHHQGEELDATQTALMETEQAFIFQEERAIAEEQERIACFTQYQRSIRWRPVRDIFFFIGGATVTGGAVWLAGGL